MMWLLKRIASGFAAPTRTTALTVYRPSPPPVIKVVPLPVLTGEPLSPGPVVHGGGGFSRGGLPKVGFCRCCGSPLTDPRSILAGYGKICALRAGQPW
jgi:hypothetical protein